MKWCGIASGNWYISPAGKSSGPCFQSLPSSLPRLHWDVLIQVQTLTTKFLSTFYMHFITASPSKNNYGYISIRQCFERKKIFHCWSQKEWVGLCSTPQKPGWSSSMKGPPDVAILTLCNVPPSRILLLPSFPAAQKCDIVGACRTYPSLRGKLALTKHAGPISKTKWQFLNLQWENLSGI